MNKISFISFLLIIMISCNVKESKTVLDSSFFCENELNLLNSFDTIPTLIGDFQYVKDSLKEKLSLLFKEDNCCKYLRFNINHFVDSIESIKLSLKYFYQCGDCPLFIRERNDCVILQNSYGQIAFEGRIINIDSLDREITNYFSKVGKEDDFPDTFDKLNIAINWDLEVSKKNFSKFINQIISGYLRSANEFSRITYKKDICHLNHEEFSKLSELIPLNIELPLIEIIEIEDELEL